MLVKAFAKINLTLDVVGKRPDGYHKLSSIMQEISMCDDVNISVKKQKGENQVFINVKKSAVPIGESNTCHKAAMLFLDEYEMADTQVKIDIKKRIPVAAGLGGGSSDAAAVIKALNSLLNVNAPVEDLEMLAANVGADVPFFIRGKTQLAEGMGEILTPLDFPYKVYYIISKPEPEAYTAEIFRDFDNMLTSGVITSASFTTAKFLKNIEMGLSPFEYVGNMLAPVVENLFTEITDIRKRLEGFGAQASMTGSGSAVFGVFSSYGAAVDALKALKRDYPNTCICVAN